MIGNTKQNYGLVHIIIHWVMAAMIIFLFATGLYMVTLTYYDPGYHDWPMRHKAIGAILAGLLILRLIWLVIQPKPQPLPNHKRWEIGFAHATHSLLYLLMIAMVVSGYVIATAKGNAIEVFGWFSIPSWFDVDSQTKLFGQIHLYSAWALIVLAAFHALGAIKHAIIDKDNTLTRMILPRRSGTRQLKSK